MTPKNRGALDVFPNGLAQGTELRLTTPFLRTHGSAPQGFVEAMQEGRQEPVTTMLPPKIPQSMISALRYICPAVVGGAVHRVEVIDHQGQCHVAIIDVEQVRRSLAPIDETNN